MIALFLRNIQINIRKETATMTDESVCPGVIHPKRRATPLSGSRKNSRRNLSVPYDARNIADNIPSGNFFFRSIKKSKKRTIPSKKAS